MKTVNLYKKVFSKKEKKYRFNDMGIIDAFQYLFGSGTVIAKHRHGNLGSL